MYSNVCSDTSASDHHKPWAVVNSHANRERLAQQQLENQGYIAYLPVIRKRIRHARRIQEVTRPLFPGYLFVAVDPEQEQWRPIMSTFGVRTLVRCGDRPGLLSNEFIVSLKAREVGGVVVTPTRTHQVGDVVTIAGGALDGVVAQIVEMQSRERVTVLLSLLNTKVKAQIEIDRIVA